MFPALGNGFQEGIGQLELGTEIRPLQAFVQVAGGYRAILDAPDDPRLQKDEVLASADVGWWPSPSLLISGSYRGRFESSDAALPETVHEVGPQLLYRVDDNLDAFAGSLHTASGKNVIHTDQYYVGVAVKRMFATGPETFNTYLQRFKQGAHEEGPSLMDTVTALAFAIDAKDHYTQGHSQTVSRLAAQIAHQIELPEPEIEEIRLAGILHDVGKIGVPESVLNKPSRLTPEEYEIMKSHTVMGWRILEPLRVKPVDRIRWMVRHHHEHFDGSGYPDGLKGADIPLGARILTIADAFDTMVSQRAYKKDRSVAEALEELQRCKGSQFDAFLVEAFVRSLEALGAFPSNEILKLN